MAKPFLKWAGGKRQLLPTIQEYLPEEVKREKIQQYVEPFVGGGAVFFWLAEQFDIPEKVLFDLNPELILAYRTIQQDAQLLINALSELEEVYLQLDEESRKSFFYEIRNNFNLNLINVDWDTFSNTWIERTSQLIFLNRTCFNGLFRVNSKGEFNVPFGKYKKPRICDDENLREVAKLLKNVKILQGDFELIEAYVNEETFVYFDPPYRPISTTSSFTSYSKNGFNDQEQLRLAKFYARMDNKYARLMLSNSDPKNEDPADNFFDDIYKGYRIERVPAVRIINSNAKGRGKINELLIMNY